MTKVSLLPTHGKNPLKMTRNWVETLYVIMLCVISTVLYLKDLFFDVSNVDAQWFPIQYICFYYVCVCIYLFFFQRKTRRNLSNHYYLLCFHFYPSNGERKIKFLSKLENFHILNSNHLFHSFSFYLVYKC